MRILFDHGVPAPLRQFLTSHGVSTAYEMGWARLSNGELLAAAEAAFDLLVTTDRNFRYQQNLAGRRLAIVVLPTTSWPRIRASATRIAALIDALSPAQYRELTSAEVPADE